MYVLTSDISELIDSIERELTLESELSAGSRGTPVRRAQEWLSLNGQSLVIDGDYGPITMDLVADFQSVHRLPVTGRVNQDTFSALTAPLRRSLLPRASDTLNGAVLAHAQAHLDQRPREVGGENRGPWVRTYSSGHEGPSWQWCAGFVTFIMRQAAESLGVRTPFAGSVSCDSLAAQAQMAGLFVSQGEARGRTIPPGSLFLCRRTESDWTHAGIVSECRELMFKTIEGNTNQNGEREGYEVCARSRGYTDKDFILLAR